MTQILNLDEAPSDPIERLLWLGGVMKAVRRELDTAFRLAYYEARLQGVFPQALALGLHSRKRAVAWTRNENEARGRTVSHWRDGLS